MAVAAVVNLNFMRPYLPAAITALLSIPIAAIQAGAGNCLTQGAHQFALASDTVQWSMTLAEGSECIQGLRHGAMLIEDVQLAAPPKHGYLTIQGPSFRYRPHPGFKGRDAFSLAISGTRLRIPGNSTVEIEVTVR
jgi:hypothetical protein